MNTQENRELLDASFRNYMEIVQSNLPGEREDPRVIRPLQFHREELRTRVGQLENQADFRQLVETARSLFSGDYHGRHAWGWEHAVKSFFRRSECYVDIFDGQSISIDEAFRLFCHAFERRKIQITYLVPLSYVDFGEEFMDFGKFQIRRFVREELAEKFRRLNRINEVFYPWAVIDVKEAIEVKMLDEYWFIVLTDATPAPKLSADPLLPPHAVDFFQGRRRIVFTEYPKAVESVLQQLTLFNWQGPVPPIGFAVPFLIVEDDNLLYVQHSAPDISILELGTHIWEDSMGNEIEQHVVPIHTDVSVSHGIESFKSFIENHGKIYMNLKPIINHENSGWKFIEVALGFFVKAFFTDGLEQLLWYITTVEALLGEEGGEKGSPPLHELLKVRISAILSDSDSKRTQIEEEFLCLYDFRCNLVHGNRDLLSNEIYDKHLDQARKIARDSLCWFLHYLDKIQSLGERPKRSNLLKIIDSDTAGSAYLQSLRTRLPASFPYVPGWTG